MGGTRLVTLIALPTRMIGEVLYASKLLNDQSISFGNTHYPCIKDLTWYALLRGVLGTCW